MTDIKFWNKIEHTLVLEGTRTRLSDVEIQRFSKLMDAEIERIALAGYPRGYDQRTGMPGALHTDAKPSPYGMIVDINGTGVTLMAHGAHRYRRDYGTHGRFGMPGGRMTRAGKRRRMQLDTDKAKHRRGRRKP